MKYIDADKLKAEIKKRKGYISVTHFAEELLSLINSLQQKQPKGEGLVSSMEELTDREILHKMLDKILDTDGAENTAIWVQYFPDFVGNNPRLVEYRLHIDTEKTVEYKEQFLYNQQ